MDIEKGNDYRDDSSDDASSTPFLEPHDNAAPRSKPKRYSTWLHWTGHLLAAAAILALALLRKDGSTLQCFDRFNEYTPMRDFVREHPYVSQPINGSKLYQSEFVGKASVDTEMAWREATRYGLLSLTKEEVTRVGYPEWSAQFPASAREDEGYPAVVVGNHQLHCLHYIWQDHHLDYYTSRAKFKDEHPGMYEGHYEHCIDFLRQRLMCHYDMSVTPYQWVDGMQAPMPGAITNEKCVDFDAMKEWMKTNTPETPDDFVWKVPKNAVVLDSELFI